MTGVAVASIGASAQPLAAQTVAECYEKVIGMCDSALAASAWWEKPIVGAMCAAMMLGCNASIVVNK
jgi:hypothetical protein